MNMGSLKTDLDMPGNFPQAHERHQETAAFLLEDEAMVQCSPKVSYHPPSFSAHEQDWLIDRTLCSLLSGPAVEVQWSYNAAAQGAHCQK